MLLKERAELLTLERECLKDIDDCEGLNQLTIRELYELLKDKEGEKVELQKRLSELELGEGNKRLRSQKNS